MKKEVADLNLKIEKTKAHYNSSLKEWQANMEMVQQQLSEEISLRRSLQEDLRQEQVSLVTQLDVC